VREIGTLLHVMDAEKFDEIGSDIAYNLARGSLPWNRNMNFARIPNVLKIAPCESCRDKLPTMFCFACSQTMCAECRGLEHATHGMFKRFDEDSILF
jgi:hypothetical protein